jgi:hypothetical protein
MRPRSGSIRTSFARSSDFVSSVLRRTMMPIIWLVTSSGDSRSSRRASGKLTSTTINRSTPVSRARLTGRLSTSPPSTSSRPPISTGASTPGADMLARRTVARSPERSTSPILGRDPDSAPCGACTGAASAPAAIGCTWPHSAAQDSRACRTRSSMGMDRIGIAAGRGVASGGTLANRLRLTAANRYEQG